MRSSRSSVLVARAHALRSFPTLSEQRLWQELRGSRLGVAFRRQVIIAGFIADFVAPSVRLVVEVDGGITSAGRRETRSVTEGSSVRAIECFACRQNSCFGTCTAPSFSSAPRFEGGTRITQRAGDRIVWLELD